VEFRYASDRSLMVYLGEAIGAESHGRVLRFLRLLDSNPIDGVLNLHPAYCSVLVVFDPVRLDHADLEAALRTRLERLESMDLPEPRTVEIPVCYGGVFGPDLNDVAALNGLTPDQVVELHCSPIYRVHFLGFAPGFAYLGGLPEALATPRLPVPRKQVPVGSVGIAGNQTGVYPVATPGGWRLIGRTSLAMFRADRDPMNLLDIGDCVRFRPEKVRQLCP
jgi:inhibitor of KinA